MNLNEKIANWCGFYDIEDAYTHVTKGDILHCPQDTLWNDRKYVFKSSLNFTESMDAILKWVVPKLSIDIEIDHSFKSGESEVTLEIFEDLDVLFYQSKADTVPMAFCLALEKHIDSQESK